MHISLMAPNVGKVSQLGTAIGEGNTAVLIRGEGTKRSIAQMERIPRSTERRCLLFNTWRKVVSPASSVMPPIMQHARAGGCRLDAFDAFDAYCHLFAASRSQSGQAHTYLGLRRQQDSNNRSWFHGRHVRWHKYQGLHMATG